MYMYNISSYVTGSEERGQGGEQKCTREQRVDESTELESHDRET